MDTERCIACDGAWSFVLGKRAVAQIVYRTRREMNSAAPIESPEIMSHTRAPLMTASYRNTLRARQSFHCICKILLPRCRAHLPQSPRMVTFLALGHLPLVRSPAQQRSCDSECKIMPFVAVHAFLCNTEVDCSLFLASRKLFVDHN